jgi:hypothetical protein
MRFKTFSFTHTKHIQKFGETELRDYRMTNVKADKLKIDLIEIKEVDNPNDMEVEVVVSGQTTILKLYRHRSKIILKNGTFILDTSDLDFGLNFTKIKDFREDIVYIKINFDWDFEVKLYCSTNQESEAFDTEYL